VYSGLAQRRIFPRLATQSPSTANETTVPTSPWPVLLAITSVLLPACTSPSSAARRQLILHDGAVLTYSVSGSGRDTVIVLEGTPGLTSQVLRRALAPLAEGRVVVHYDMRGRGESPVVPAAGSPSFHGDIDDLEELRAALDLSRMSLVGHYYGAAVATFYARQHPDRVSRLVLLAPMQPKASNSHELSLWSTRQPGGMAPYFEALRAHQDSLDPSAFCRAHWLRFLEPVWVDDEQVRAAHAGDACPSVVDVRSIRRVRDSLVVSLNRAGWEQWLDSLPSVRQPALVLGGSADPVRRFLFRWWAYALPDGRVLLLDESEPTFPWVLRPGDVNGSLRTFLNGEWPAGSLRPAEPVPDATTAEQARMPMSAALIDR
jgi:pimeloyl-ACP methyl ester carboxylesterase